jgi:hypothetical protein
VRDGRELEDEGGSDVGDAGKERCLVKTEIF